MEITKKGHYFPKKDECEMSSPGGPERRRIPDPAWLVEKNGIPPRTNTLYTTIPSGPVYRTKPVPSDHWKEKCNFPMELLANGKYHTVPSGSVKETMSFPDGPMGSTLLNPSEPM